MCRAIAVLILGICSLSITTTPTTAAESEQPLVLDNDSAYAEFVSQIPRIQSDDVNLNLLIDAEGFDSSIYYPGGASGPTLGAGLDLGNMGARNIVTMFDGVVSDSLLAVLKTADGKTGRRAQQWIDKHKVTITKYQANTAFCRALNVYWRETKRRFPGVLDLDREMRGLVLSLCYGFGPRNPKLAPLDEIIAKRDASHMQAFMQHLANTANLTGLRNRHTAHVAFVRSWSSVNGGDMSD